MQIWLDEKFTWQQPETKYIHRRTLQSQNFIAYHKSIHKEEIDGIDELIDYHIL